MEKNMFFNEALNKCQNDKNILLSYQKTICLCNAAHFKTFICKWVVVIVINVCNKQWTPNEGLSEATFAKSIKQIERVSHLVSQSVSQSVSQ